MKNFAPDIYRQRLVVEGIYGNELMQEIDLSNFLVALSKIMGMHIICGPKVMNLAGAVNAKHAGLEGVMIWAESGVQCYTWSKQSFFSCDIYSCKLFNVKKTVAFIKDYFMCKKIDHKSV